MENYYNLNLKENGVRGYEFKIDDK